MRHLLPVAMDFGSELKSSKRFSFVLPSYFSPLFYEAVKTGMHALNRLHKSTYHHQFETSFLKFDHTTLNEFEMPVKYNVIFIIRRVAL